MDVVGPALRRAARDRRGVPRGPLRRAGHPDCESSRHSSGARSASRRADVARRVLSELVETATPGLMASSGPRYFGFVIGGSLDCRARRGRDHLGLGPERVQRGALAGRHRLRGRRRELAQGAPRAPETASVGFATGGRARTRSGWRRPRHVLNEIGWDVGRDGLQGAPKVRVVVGEERHGTIDRPSASSGFGESAIVAVPALPERGDGHRRARRGSRGGRRADDRLRAGRQRQHRRLRRSHARLRRPRAVGAWVHVDGAFGLWAAASPADAAPRRRASSSPTRGRATGTSGSTSRTTRATRSARIPRCTRPRWHTPPPISPARCAGACSAAATSSSSRRDGPAASRRGRRCATLGRSGVAELVERCCELARRFADGLRRVDGVEIVNDVVLNQVLVRVGDARR